MDDTENLTETGRFVIGCNYWASHAGTAMWSDWRPEVVNDDLKQLAEAGLHVLRVFPLWPDFQPLCLLQGGNGTPREYRLGEEPLPADGAGAEGMSEAALQRFSEFADMAGLHGLKLSVALLTGWMSGRLFVPPALAGRAIHTDPVALMWQVRFVRCFVGRFVEHPAIVSWGLGNECNCMGGARTREEAWTWTALISQTIRVEDPCRRIVSGMHGLQPGGAGVWTIQDQAEWADVLTTHPYPLFTPKCDQEPIHGIRNCLHAVAESRLYADVGKAPCMVEEIGTLGPMICSEEVAAAYIRTVLFSSWAHDCRGLFWWCAYDQDRLEGAPYDWNSVERELGLIRSDRSHKPVLDSFTDFRSFLDALPFHALPPRLTDAVCILTRGQDHWAAAFSSFILAKQGGLDLEFQYEDQPLRESSLYIVPSATGGSSFSRRRWLELLRRVREDGTTLFLTCNDVLLSPFNEPFGADVVTRERRTGPARVDASACGLDEVLTCRGPFRLNLAPTSAEVLAREEDGNPVFLRNQYGKGTVYFLAFPIELQLADTHRAFDIFPCGPFHALYRYVAEAHLTRRVARGDSVHVGLSEHILAPDRRLLVLVNYHPEAATTVLNLVPPWVTGHVLRGEEPAAAAPNKWSCALPGNDALVLDIRRQ